MGDTESIRKYRFRERTDFLVFLEENRSLFIDRKIKGFYNGTAFGYGSDSPVVLEFDGHCVMFDYLFLSSIKIAVFPFTAALINMLTWDYHITITMNDLTKNALDEYIQPFFEWEREFPIVE